MSLRLRVGWCWLAFTLCGECESPGVAAATRGNGPPARQDTGDSTTGELTRDQLRSQVEAAIQHGVTDGDLDRLGASALRVAETSKSPSAFWSAMGLAADLCRAGPRAPARSLRAEALAMLTRRPASSIRWSSLIREQLLPHFAAIQPEAWAEELDHHDRCLRALMHGAPSSLVRAQLLHAQIFSRMHIDRRWDWLDEPRRQHTFNLIEELEQRFGDDKLPGASATDPRRIRDVAAGYREELTRLAFRAPAPRTAGTDLQGRPLDLREFLGEIVILDFWTSFCQPCLALVPHVRSLLASLDGEPVVYVGVNGDTQRAAGLATARRVGMNWRNLWDGPRGTAGPAATAWAVGEMGWPSVFLIDRAGRIRVKLRGKPQIEAELEAAVRGLLAEEDEQAAGH